jgi:hypothetical protein
MKSRKNKDHISEIMNDPERVRLIIQSAINDALLKHKQAGNSVCELRDGKVVWINPKDIVVSNK